MARRAWLPGAVRPSSQRTATPSSTRSMPTARAPLSRRTPRRSSSSSRAAATSESFCGQHLLAGHDQGDLAPERAEHVDELHAGDPGADHHEVLGPQRRRVGVAGGQDPLRRRRSPSRAGAGGCRWRAARRRRPPRPRRRWCRPRTVCGPVRRPAPRRMRTPWLSSSCRTPCSSFCSMASMRAFSASGSTVAAARGEPHLRGAARPPPGRRRWRSSPSTGCSPTGGRPRRSRPAR